jgi:pseudouridine-5'-monophosphatase
MSITHCIFDLDGLLLDTESIYTECLQKLCAPYGKYFTTEAKLKMMGKSSLEAGQILIRKLFISLNEKKLSQNFS